MGEIVRLADRRDFEQRVRDSVALYRRIAVKPPFEVPPEALDEACARYERMLRSAYSVSVPPPRAE